MIHSFKFSKESISMEAKQFFKQQQFIFRVRKFINMYKSYYQQIFLIRIVFNDSLFRIISLKSKASILDHYINYLMQNLPFFKIVVLGEARVGKTSISLKFVQNKFDENQKSSINVSYLQKNVTLSNGKLVKLAIWDTAGQQEYNAIAPVYYRDAYGAIIVYQITSYQSFQKVKKWMNQLKQYADKKIIINIAGNKCDMESMRKIKKIEVQKFAQQNNAKHFEVSAKNGLNIDELFLNICQRIYPIRISKDQSLISVKKSKKVKILGSNQDSEERNKQKNCC